MKRGGQLKRTPLKRGDSQLKRTTKLNQVSAKTKAMAPIRAKVTAEVRLRGTCEIGPLLCTFARRGTEGMIAAVRYERGLDPARDIELLYLYLRTNACRGVAASDVHEPGARSRAIGSQYDIEQCVLSCRPCHSLTHEHPALARAVGATL